MERHIEGLTTGAPDRIEQKKPEDLDSVIQLMKELRLRQAEAQKSLEEQMVFISDVFTKSSSSMPQTPLQPRTNAPYYLPNQYGNREYPPSPGAHRTNVRGCYWDGKRHGRDNCDELLKAINTGEVHRKGKVLYLGQEGVRDSVRVTVAVEI